MYPIGLDSLNELNNFLKSKNYSSIYILTDSNTHEYCSREFLQNLETEISIEIIEIDAGEEQKNIEICIQLWDLLLNYGADKNSLLINLGGGVISDLGGFVASTYKRGIDFINIPTTLLAMVDASIGGKNGIDFGFLKNQIGTISNPEMIIIYPKFLETLPYNQLLSGFAEMIKHALIFDQKHWNEIKQIEKISTQELEDYIAQSVSIKLEITTKDPQEKNIRKLLNFGHTLGHAIESYYLENQKEITHGHAIAVGMLLESQISLQLNKLTLIEFLEIEAIINKFYAPLDLSLDCINKIIELLKFDKKNSHGNIKFALIEKIGSGIFDIIIDNQLILNAFDNIKKK